MKIKNKWLWLGVGVLAWMYFDKKKKEDAAIAAPSAIPDESINSADTPGLSNYYTY